jgi:hypothetical protein
MLWVFGRPHSGSRSETPARHQSCVSEPSWPPLPRADYNARLSVKHLGRRTQFRRRRVSKSEHQSSKVFRSTTGRGSKGSSRAAHLRIQARDNATRATRLRHCLTMIRRELGESRTKFLEIGIYCDILVSTACCFLPFSILRALVHLSTISQRHVHQQSLTTTNHV